jgi:DNA-binding transcriptional ArsR family regulator
MAKKVIGTKEFIDPITGEPKRFLILDVGVKDGKFVKVYQAFTQELIQRLDYLNGALKVLMWFVDQYIRNGVPNKLFKLYVDYSKIAKELNMGERTVRAHIKKLKELDILIQPTKYKPIFLLNPKYVWIGDAENLAKILTQPSLFDDLPVIVAG